MRAKTITCPAGEVESFEPGQIVEFDPEACGPCQLRNKCTYSASGGRTIRIAEDEQRQHRLRKLASTKSGRERLRKRTGIEHRLAHTAAREGTEGALPRDEEQPLRAPCGGHPEPRDHTAEGCVAMLVSTCSVLY